MNPMNKSFEAEDIINTVINIREKNEDDSVLEGVNLLACELLECSEETLKELIENQS